MVTDLIKAFVPSYTDALALIGVETTVVKYSNTVEAGNPDDKRPLPAIHSIYCYYGILSLLPDKKTRVQRYIDNLKSKRKFL